MSGPPQAAYARNSNLRRTRERHHAHRDRPPPAPATGVPSPPRGGTALAASGGVFFAAEFIAAAAWTDPPYSYTHHFISNLGVRGPATAFGQFMYSPLAWVMNLGFLLFGLGALAGVLLLTGLPGRRRWPVVATAAMLAAGGVILAFFPGTGEVTDDGATDYHGLGAFLAFVAGNVLAILLGRMHQLLGLPRGLGRAVVAAGLLGLMSIVAFGAVLASDAGVLIGLAERGIVYPFLIAFVFVGTALRRAPVSVVSRGGGSTDR